MWNSYYLVAYGSVILVACAQLLLKKGASLTQNKNFLRSFINPYSLLAYCLLVLITLCNLYALKVVQLKEMAFILALPFVLVPLLSMALFKERLTRQQLLGVLLIIVGALVFNLDVLLA